MSVSKGERPQVDMTPLIQLITTSIAPGTWQVQDSAGQDVSSAYGLGGRRSSAVVLVARRRYRAPERPPGAIIPFFLSISLIIRHTAEVHEQVADLLRQLRRLQDLQVSIEVRFITVSDNFFEQIGVDFDFEILSNAVGKHTTFAFPNPAAELISTPGSPITTSGGTAGTTGGGTTAAAPRAVPERRRHYGRRQRRRRRRRRCGCRRRRRRIGATGGAGVGGGLGGGGAAAAVPQAAAVAAPRRPT